MPARHHIDTLRPRPELFIRNRAHPLPFSIHLKLHLHHILQPRHSPRKHLLLLLPEYPLSALLFFPSRTSFNRQQKLQHSILIIQIPRAVRDDRRFQRLVRERTCAPGVRLCFEEGRFEFGRGREPSGGAHKFAAFGDRAAVVSHGGGFRGGGLVGDRDDDERKEGW